MGIKRSPAGLKPAGCCGWLVVVLGGDSGGKLKGSLVHVCA